MRVSPLLLPPLLTLLLLSLVITTTTTSSVKDNIVTSDEQLNDEYVKAVGNFGFNLLREFKDKTFTIASFSLWKLLNRIAIYAAGNTKQQILDALGIKKEIIISSPTEKTSNSSKDITQHQLADILKMKELNEEKSELDYTKQITNFNSSDPESVRKIINNLVNKASKGANKDDAIGLKDTEIFLHDINHMKGKWDVPFDSQMSKKRNFFSLPDPEGIMIMMVHNPSLLVKNGINKKLNARVLQLPMDGNKKFMTAFLPVVKTYDAFIKFIQSLTYENFIEATKNLKKSNIELYFPKIEMISRFSDELKQGLKNMGITDAFGKEANFPDLGHNTYLSRMSVTSLIVLDEEGSINSALSEGDIIKGRSFEHLYQFNRPFVIVFHKGNLIQYVGAYSKPHMYAYE